MSGRRSRSKGARGERDFRDLVRRHGFDADRDGRLAADLRHDVPGVHFEVKRCETITLGKWLRQAEAECGDDVPVVAFRQSNQPWRVVVPADEYLQAKADQAALNRYRLGTLDSQ
jgi:Holliday junction resolvase